MSTTTKQCEVCGKPYKPKTGARSRYCSMQCLWARPDDRWASNRGRTKRQSIEDILKTATPSPSGCLELPQPKAHHYCRVSFKGVEMYAHRAAYLAIHGEIPDGLVVRHKCDNPLCCNPDHLEIGTHQDNSRDARKRKRLTHLVKLTESQVLEIRSLAEAGARAPDLARRFNVTRSNVYRIISRATWDWLTAPRPLVQPTFDFPHPQSAAA